MWEAWSVRTHVSTRLAAVVRVLVPEDGLDRLHYFPSTHVSTENTTKAKNKNKIRRTKNGGNHITIKHFHKLQ